MSDEILTTCTRVRGTRRTFQEVVLLHHPPVLTMKTAAARSFCAAAVNPFPVFDAFVMIRNVLQIGLMSSHFVSEVSASRR